MDNHNSNGSRPNGTRTLEVSKEPYASGGAFEGAYGPSLKELFGVVRKRLWLLVLAAITLAGIAVGFSILQTPTYEASIRILISQEGEPSGNPGSLEGEVSGLQQLTQTMTEAVNRPPITGAVIEQLGLQTTSEDLQKNLNVEQVRATQFIQVSYKDTNPVRVQQVANAVGDEFSNQISEVSPTSNSMRATVLERAEVPDEPVSPDPVRNGLVALAIGAMLGVVLAFLLEYLDESWRSREEVERTSGVPTFGIIPEYWAAEGLVTIREPGSAAAEAYRSLRTNLLHAAVDASPKVVVFTSPGPREGKSTTCANLGVTLAQTGRNILVLDCDFRKPELHRYFGLHKKWGLVDMLAEGSSLREFWEEPVEGLKVLPAGSVPPDPAELLDSRRFSELLAGVREEFDYVLLDVSPVEVVSDAAILAAQSDGVLLVLDGQKTSKASVRQSVRSLEAIGASILGTVVNKVSADKSSSYGGYGYNREASRKAEWLPR